jgi:hypothetical protein
VRVRHRTTGTARVAPAPYRSLRGVRVRALLVALTGLLLLAVALVALVARHGEQLSTTGQERARALAAAAAPEPGRSPAVPVQSGRPGEPAERPRPVEVRIDALEVAAEVDEVGVDPDSGLLALPAEGHRLGWYRHGPGLGSPAGSTVIAGHVDTAAGPGALYRLGDLSPGDRVVVAGSDGSDRTFDVVAREIHHKAELPLARYFARDGAPRLTLITCGGPFDPESRHYRDNIVVTAVPVDADRARPEPDPGPRR